MADAKLSALTTGAAVAATDLFYSAQDAGGGSFNQVKQAASAVRTYMGGTAVVANEVTDTTCFPVFVTAATGELGLKTNADLAFNSSTGSLTLGGQLSFGSVLGASATDISNHISLFGGTWGFGVSSGQINIVAGGVAVASASSTALTLAGNLSVTKATPQIFLDKAAAGQTAIIGGRTAGILRWQIHMGSIAAESGSDAGSDFILQRISDAGVNLGNPITVTRSTGVAAFTASPTAPTPAVGTNSTALATTAYVRAETVIKTGDTMSGNLAIVAAGNAALSMAKGASANIIQMPFYTGSNIAANLRWQIVPSNATAESGSNAGSDFQIIRYSDTGASLGSVLSITRSTGVAAFGGAITTPTPAAGTNSTTVATTAFVQNAVLNTARPQRFISGAASPVGYVATDQIVTFDVTSGAGITYALPTAATRNGTASGLPISFKDVTGCFSGHNLTINCSETIDGLAAPLVLTNNFAGVTLWPRTDGGTGWFML